MKYPEISRRSNGKLWPAGHTVLGLCAAWNHATDPSALRTTYQHSRLNAYARAIDNRMGRLDLCAGRDYKELSSGIRWPIRRKP